MSARVLRFSDYAPKTAKYALLLADLPGRTTEPVGVLLFDPSTDALHIRLRRDWEAMATEEDVELLVELEDDLSSLSNEFGGAYVLEKLENEFSNSLRISDPESIPVHNFDKTLSELYRQHVPCHVLRFRTHLPSYSLAVAAGAFLTNADDIEAKEWIEAPRELKLDANMFVARIKGHSMEPRIPDGSLCVFRHGVVGSRNGRLVLVRNSELADDNQYTVKRYRSEKIQNDDGFLQRRIRLESLNPAYPSWDLEEDAEKYQIIAEFVRVLE
jgi:SOS-response transcriptional repressor LexA